MTLNALPDAARIAALRRYGVLDTAREPEFDDLVQAAARICDMPIAGLSFVDSDRQWFKAETGLGLRETPLDASVCRRLVAEDGDLLVIPDLSADHRHAGNPLVCAGPGLRAYAGVVLRSSDGFALGALCALDVAPRTPDPGQLAGLRALARAAMDQLELRVARRRLEQLRATPTDAFAVLGADLRIGFANVAAAGLLGTPAADLIGARLWPEADGARTARAFVDAVARGGAFELQARPSGRWLAATAEPAGSGWGLHLRDVTEERRGRERLTLLESAMARIDDIVLITEGEPVDQPGPRIVYANAAFERRTGFAPAEYLGATPRILQGPRTQRAELDRLRAALTAWRPARVELINYARDGEEFWLELDVAPITDDRGFCTHWVAVQRDVTARKREQIAAGAEARALDMISVGSPIGPVLDVIARAVEAATPGVRCAIHLVDAEGRLRTGAAPSMPAAFVAATDGVAIGPGVGSCGAAAWRRAPVAVADIATDPLWDDWRELALGFGLRACWSTPVPGPAGGVAATFALYRDAPGAPTPSETAMVDRFVRLVAAAAERVRALGALRDSEARLTALVAATSDADWEADAEGRMVHVSAGWTAFTGQPVAAALGGGWIDAVHPEDRARVAAEWRDVLARGAPAVAEFRVRAAGGGWRWNQARVAPLRGPDGQVRRWFGLSFDVSDRREVEGRLRAVAEVAADAVWDLDLVNRRIVWSDGLKAAFGHDFSRDDAPLGTWNAHIHPEDADRVLRGFTAAIAGGARQWQAEYRFTRGDGAEAVVIDRAVILRDEDGRAVRAIGSVADVTPLREAEDKLRQAQRLEAVGQLTGGVAHDFNNLLTVILGAAEMIEDTAPAGDELRQLAGMTRAAAERGAELTQRLLAFSRRQPLDPRPTNVARLLAEMDPMLRRTLGGHIEVELIQGGGLWPALIDPGQLESAVLNLCINARDAMPSGGRLTIETANAHLDDDYARENAEARPGQYVLLSVSDTGVGMDAATRARAFEPFFTTKQPGRGSGLGLSMVYGFIRQSCGHVKIYSEPGHGATARLYLPRAGEPERPAPARGTAFAPVGGSETVLAVEDDAAVRQHAERLLLSLGYQVVIARDGPEALAALAANPAIAVLFTDVVMPGGMNGPQLAEAARRIRPDLAVLFTSGYTENAIVHQGRLDPGVHLLNKPYRRLELATKLRAAIDAPR